MSMATAAAVGKDIIEMFCGMHVGVNLWAAEVKGLRLCMVELGESSVGFDIAVHSACKLLGHLGNPEYGCSWIP